MASLDRAPLYRPPRHRRPLNTTPARMAAQVRGVIAARLAERLEAGLPHICQRLGLSASQGAELLGLVLAVAEPGEYADDPVAAAYLAALRLPELVPDAGLERCGPAQLAAYLADPDPAPAAFDPAETRTLLAGRYARLRATGRRITPGAALARLLDDARRAS